MSRIRGLELLFNIETKNFKSAADCVVAAFHCLLINEGLQCVGIGDVWPDSAEPTTEMLPKDWNKNQDVYSLRYANKGRVNRVLLKVARADHMLMVNAVMNETTVATMSFPVSTYVSDSYEDYSTAFKDLESLAKAFQKEIMENLLKKSKEKSPEKPPRKRHSPSSSGSTSPTLPQRPAAVGIPDHLVFPPPPSLPRVGGSDLDPLGWGGGGGMFMDPSGFGVPSRPSLPQFGIGGPGGLPRGAVPPGARFDPFMPPIGQRWSGPNPDHLRRPDFEDDFM